VTDRSALEQLAAHLGILPEYFDQSGERHVTSDDTRRAFLAGMGFPVVTDADAREALQRLEDADRRALLPPVRVVVQGDPLLQQFDVHTPASRSGGPWRVAIELEDGRRYDNTGVWRPDETIQITFPGAPPLGYHRVTMSLSHAGVEWSDEQTLIVVPSRCLSPEEVVGPEGAFGLITNLYTVRSASNWGIGDFTDLAMLGECAGRIGADFVGVNPLHALLDRGMDISPYSPISRRFRNTIYIDVIRVPELELLPELRERLQSPEIAAQLAALRECPTVRYEQVMAVKGLALDALHDAFTTRVLGSGDERDRAYAAYVALHEPELSRFATWMAIVEEQMRGSGNGSHGNDWRAWPEKLQSPESPAVEAFAVMHAARIDFHRWLQFEADCQLAAAATRARQAGMRIGLYQDLAIGTSAAGADTWSRPEMFVRGVAVGAPPDPLAMQGQNWGLPPLDPRALRADRYRYFIDLVRAGLRHGGALRIDHVLGLFRLFWIPDGMSGRDGAYVRYPSHELLGILALESVRHNALIVGEDLGTVPPDVPPALAKWGILSSKVLQFERTSDGGYRHAQGYPRLALATANTHDMATIAGFWAGRDIDVRRQVGLIANDDDYQRAQNDRANDRRALLYRLADERVMHEAREPSSSAELRDAIHAFLCRTPALLVGLSLDDIAGETEPVNVPGVGADRYPSWSRKMTHTLETIEANAELSVSSLWDDRKGARSSP
jgi:4-alpha-glucanotransferase